jgi:peptide/nickel transport system substrate-binding protein
MVYFVRYGPDPGAYNEHFATGGPRNFMGYSNADVDRALDAGLSTVSADSRRQFYFQVQNQLVKDLPYVHLAPSPYFFLASNNLKGFASEKEVWGKAGPWHGGFRLTQPR